MFKSFILLVLFWGKHDFFAMKKRVSVFFCKYSNCNLNFSTNLVPKFDTYVQKIRNQINFQQHSCRRSCSATWRKSNQNCRHVWQTQKHYNVRYVRKINTETMIHSSEQKCKDIFSTDVLTFILRHNRSYSLSRTKVKVRSMQIHFYFFVKRCVKWSKLQ